MPTFIVMGEVVLVAALAAAATLLIAAWPWKTAPSWRCGLGWVVGIGMGFYVGSAVLGQWPRWPPLEDRDRLLTILLPIALGVEVIAALVKPPWVAWIARLALAGVAAPILLNNTTYLADLAGPGSAEWLRAQACAILGGLAAVLASVWALLELLQSRASDRSGAPILSLTALAAAATVALSGYFKGGLLGLPLAGALAGASLASLVVPRQPSAAHGLGVGLVGIFSVLVIGRFFGSLPTSLAVGVFLAPLLAWIAEVPGLRKTPPGIRTVVRVAVVAVPLIVVVAIAQIRFWEALKSRSF